MKRSIVLLTITAVALFLAVNTSAFAQAAGTHFSVPASNLEQPGHFHTNLIAVLPDNAIAQNSPPTAANTPASVACVYKLVSPLVSGCPIATTTKNPSGGKGAIAIVDAYDDPNAVSDLNTYSSQFGLPAATFQVLYASGKKPGVDPTGGWELEEALDIEISHAMAPAAQLFLVEAASNSDTDLYNAETFAYNTVAAAGGGVVSNSWSSSEFSGETSDDHYVSGQGVVFFASTGDSAFAKGYPAMSPNVVAAGGTTVQRDSSGNFTTEIYWDNQYGGGGGGISSYEKIPPYQTPIKSIVGTHRGVPDISLVADPATGVAEYDSYAYEGFVYDWLQIGGTSVSSPALAGIINAAGTLTSTSTTGSELTKFYKEYANANQYKQVWRDITGTNSNCKVGWDICTGIGVPITYRGK